MTDKRLSDETTEDLKALRFHTRYGDLAGIVFNSIKQENDTLPQNVKNRVRFPRRADRVVERLREEMGVARGTSLRPHLSKAAEKPGSFAGHFVDLVDTLDPPIDADTALFAVEAYVSRNEACHVLERNNPTDNEGQRLSGSRKFARMAELFDSDSSALGDVLPTKWIGDKGLWEEIVNFAKLSKLHQDAPGEPWTIWGEEVESDSADDDRAPNVQRHDWHRMTFVQHLPNSAQTILFDAGHFRAPPMPAKRVRRLSDDFQEELRQAKRVRSEEDPAESSSATPAASTATGDERTAVIGQVVQLVQSCDDASEKFLKAAEGTEDWALEALAKTLKELQEVLDSNVKASVEALKKKANQRRKLARRAAGSSLV